MKETSETRQSDHKLVRQVQEGDMLAFRNLVQRYKDVSFSLACSILKDEVESEDVLQDAFMKVLNSIHKFRFESSFSTWLYRIVVNVCFDVRKKSKGHLHEDLQVVEEQKWDGHSSLETFSEKERSIYIANTFKLMKPDEALLLRLYYLCELSIREIEDVTQLSASNIKVTLFRARKNMYSILNRILGKEIDNLL